MIDHDKRIPMVVVISGPSGVGKDATIARMKETGDKFHYVVTATTRQRRQREQDGVDYYFLSEQDFKDRVEKGEFLEYARVYNNMYGVLKSEVRQALSKGQDVIIKVDVQGAATLKKKIPNALFIFLEPPSLDDLAERLKVRNSDSEHAVTVRMGKADEELQARQMFDCTVVNVTGNLDITVKAVKDYIEKHRGTRGPVVI